MTHSSTSRARYPASLSVFFPCYNEAGNIEPLVARTAGVLGDLVEDWEIIIVDDGSTDGTGQIADRLAAGDPRIRAVHHVANGGYGTALRSGLAAATKDYVFYTDGDGQFDVAELPHLLDRLGEADIISGYRRRRAEGLRRRLNAAAWGCLVQGVLRFRCRDVDSAFKLYRRGLIEGMNLQSTGALINAEILARAARRGGTLRTVPVSHYPRRAGTQTGAKLRVILRALWELRALRRDILTG